MRRYHFLCISLWLAFTAAAANTILSPSASCATPLECRSTIFPTIGQQSWAQLLGWVPTDTNLCHGYFFEPAAITAVPNPPPIGVTETTINATGRVVYSQTGVSTLEGVTVTQPGREVYGDKAFLYRNPKTGKFNRIDLVGNVRFREAGKLLVSHYASLDLENKTLAVTNNVYQITRPAIYGPTHGWGVSASSFRESNTNLQLDNATYTTCAPTDPQWHIGAKHIALNKQTGRGVATNAWFYAAHQPVLYVPYFNFPIDHRRYSGFLYPTFGYDYDSGWIASLPYYFNLAPNFDDTLTLTGMSLRGVQMANLFRYLTNSSDGNLWFSFLPDDRKFARFKDQAADEYPPSNPTNIPYLNALADDSTNRAALSFENNTIFSDQWSGAVDLNYVSDAYYMRDFGNGPRAVTTDQLLNQALINYQSTNWQFTGRVQAYQTLHLIDQVFVADQYQRLPQLDLNGNYPNAWLGMDYLLNTEYTDFQHPDDFFNGTPFPTGSRVHLYPAMKKPLLNSWGYFTPSLGLDVTGYGVVNNGVVSSDGSTVVPFDNPNLNRVRTLPIFNIDSGIYLERYFLLGSHSFKQTLEPRVFYLFVPTTNQFDIPIFDSSLPTFNFEQMFLTNRFVGFDRLGDANQISVGLTTRFLNGYSGDEKLSASIGEIYYFHPHSVCLYANCSDDPTIDDKVVSPIAGELNFNPNPLFTLTSNAAFDPNHSTMNNSSVSVLFHPTPTHIFKVGYQYVQNGDILQSANPGSEINNLRRIDLGAAMPLSEHWSALGDWNYNISHGHSQTYFYGVQYDSCCWALRLVSNRTLTAEQANGATNYRTNIYLQFLLKGLGSVGSRTGSKLIMQSLPGYQDIFRG